MNPESKESDGWGSTDVCKLHPVVFPFVALPIAIPVSVMTTLDWLSMRDPAMETTKKDEEAAAGETVVVRRPATLQNDELLEGPWVKNPFG